MAVLAIDADFVRMFQLFGDIGKQAAHPLALRIRPQTICHRRRAVAKPTDALVAHEVQSFVPQHEEYLALLRAFPLAEVGMRLAISSISLLPGPGPLCANTGHRQPFATRSRGMMWRASGDEWFDSVHRNIGPTSSIYYCKDHRHTCALY